VCNYIVYKIITIELVLFILFINCEVNIFRKVIRKVGQRITDNIVVYGRIVEGASIIYVRGHYWYIDSSTG